MIKDLIIEHIFNIVMSILGGTSLLGWVLERNKRKSEERQSQADALKSMQEAYDKFTKDFNDRYDALMADYDKVKMEIKILRAKLETTIKLAADERERIYNEFEEYKKKHPTT